MGRDEEGVGGLTRSANIAAGTLDVDDTRLVLRRRRWRRRCGSLVRRRSRRVRGRVRGRVVDLWRVILRVGVGVGVGVMWAGEAAFLAGQPPSDAVVAGGNGGCDDDISSQNGKGEQSKELHANKYCWARG